MGDHAWKVSLNAYHSKLRTGLLIVNVLPALRPLLTDAEYSCVKDKESNVDSIDELVKILLAKDKSTFEGFCSALEANGYPRWASKLRGKGAQTASQVGFVGNPPLQQSDAAASLEWDHKAFWSSLIEFIQKIQGTCPVFGVLVVGETGTGKSTLINNLMGKNVVGEGDTLHSETATITKHKLDVEGVPVTLYDTPGLSDSRSDRDSDYLHQIKGILKSGDIHLVIYCLKLSETRMRMSLIRTFQEYNNIGVNWEWTIITLTFADAVPVPSSERKKPGFDIGHFFNDRLAEMQACITRTLVERVGVAPEVASEVTCNPSTSDPNEKLVNGERWFVPFWLDVLELLSPGAAMQFLEMRANNIDNLQLNPQDEEKLTAIMKKQIKAAARIGAIAGGAIGMLGGPLGVLVGAGVGSAIGSGIGLFKSLFSRKKKN